MKNSSHFYKAFPFALAMVFALSSTPVLAVGYGGSTPPPSGGVSNSSGGSGNLQYADCYTPVTPSADGFSIVVKATNLPGQVALEINGGTAARMAISNDPAFIGATQQPYAHNIAWNLPATNQGEYTLYVRFYNACGLATSVVTRTYKNPVIGTQEGQVLGEKISLIDELLNSVTFGKRSEDVRTLQEELKRLGYLPKNWVVNNLYGTATLNALTSYMSAGGGSLKEAEIDALIRVLKPGKVDPRVKKLQRALQIRGFISKRLVTTSYYGRTTRAAVAKYLKSKVK